MKDKENPAPGEGEENGMSGSDKGVFATQTLNLAFNGRRLRKDARLRRQTEKIICNLIALRGGQTFDEIYEFVVNNLRQLEPYIIPALANLCHTGSGHRRKLIDEIDEDGCRTYYADEMNPWWLE